LIERRQALHLKISENQERIDALQEQLRSTQKLATLGTMACLVAHEFNNILMPMINYAELALKNVNDVDLMRKALEKTLKHGNRAAVVIESMMGMVRNETKSRETFNLAEMVSDCFNCLARDFGRDQIKVKIDIPSDLTLEAVPSQLQQVIINLIINARQAMLEKGGLLKIEARQKDSTRVLLQISDTGCGIEPDIMKRIFEPFFSTKTEATRPDQQGTGLGLAICKDIIENHAGSINVESKPGKSTTFFIELPAFMPPEAD
jgi:signal transduction histidine kinase